ncbi:hypothetical protein ACFXPY_10230 [Streptomyces sp. NPDC059153]
MSIWITGAAISRRLRTFTIASVLLVAAAAAALAVPAGSDRAWGKAFVP